MRCGSARAAASAAREARAATNDSSVVISVMRLMSDDSVTILMHFIAVWPRGMSAGDKRILFFSQGGTKDAMSSPLSVVNSYGDAPGL